MKNKISIVIPTFKRKKYLINLLNSMKGKLPKNTEVIIVEQKENNKNAFFQTSKKLSIQVKYFFVQEPNTAKAKNIGVSMATGEYIIFFDDDVRLKTLVLPYIENFKNKEIAAVTGRSLAKGQFIERKRNNVGKISLLGKFSDGYSSLLRQYVDTVIGCNVCWRKDIFNKIGGFDEQFSGNAMREESDLSLRAKNLGYKILFDPRVVIFHDRAISGGARKTEGRLKWYFDFFSNETYFFLKHRVSILVPIILLTRANWALRCMFGFGREVSLRSMTTPILGIFDGYRKYIRFKYENRS